MSIFALAGSIASGVMSMKAAKTQASAIKKGIAEQRRQYDQSRQDMMPWMEAGERSLGDIERELGSEYEASKGYDWQVKEGEKALQSQMAALGFSDSGVHMKEAVKWGQGLASTDYDKWFDRKAGIAGAGQQQSNSLASLGANYANNAAKSYNALGEAEGSGWAGVGNAISNYTEQQSKMMGAGYGSIGGGS